jgi:mRNA (guanine-N7-)-methyltransferase
MLNFHNLCIKKELYLKPSSKNSLLELACGEGGDMSRWIDSGYKFILGVDLVKKNIYNPRSGAYSRMLREKNKYARMQNQEKIYLPNIVFVVGDCSKNIKNGESSRFVKDFESEKILNVVMKNNKNYDKNYKHIVSKGLYGFDAVSCMFAIHYFFENEEKLDGFLNNVSQNLKKGGLFFCTFMDGTVIRKAIDDNDGDKVIGIKKLETDNIPVWAIIRRYNNDDDDDYYNKKIDVFIENTQKLIPEYLVNFNFLIEKAKEFNLVLHETELFSESFNKIKSQIPIDENERTNIQEDVLKLDNDEVQKQFSFFNRWATFMKI